MNTKISRSNNSPFVLANEPKTLAYLFILKSERFRFRWFHHELDLDVFAKCIYKFTLSFAFNKLVTHIPESFKYPLHFGVCGLLIIICLCLFMLSHLVRDLWLLNKLRSLKRPYFWYWYLEQINTAVKLKLLANKSTRYF